MASSTDITLYQAEQDLVTFLDTAEGGVPAEQEKEFAAEFVEQLKTTVAKRDRTGQFLRHLKTQEEFAREEAQRMTDRARRFAAARERIEEYIEYTILSLPRDHKGKPKKLEGQSVTLQLRACPDSVVVHDEAAIPLAYKHVTAKMPALVWESLFTLARRADSVAAEVLLREIGKSDVSVDKKAIRTAIAANIDVPGADLSINNFSVEVK